MCQCTPNIRTPYCGKGDCVWPEQKHKEGERVVAPSIRVEAETSTSQFNDAWPLVVKIAYGHVNIGHDAQRDRGNVSLRPEEWEWVKATVDALLAAVDAAKTAAVAT